MSLCLCGEVLFFGSGLTAMYGIMRLPRRPPGWCVPGPLSTGPRDDPRLWPQPNEDLCYLSGHWQLLQRVDGHRWSLDDLVTAWVAADAARGAPLDRVLDLGCGIGAVLLMLAWRFSSAHLVGVEAQAISVDLARRSVAWNGARDCEVRLGDLRAPDVVSEVSAFDLITATPPYLPAGTATEPSRVQCGPCHIEQRGGIEDYCHVAARAMQAAGRFVTCFATAQQARVEAAAVGAALVIVRRLEVIPRAGKSPLFSVFVMRHRAQGSARRADPPLIVRDITGQRTPRFQALRHDMGLPP